ncbi:response regulator transcription factor [Paenibacillus sp. sgz302251]|uniref:response regulator transcription factor n=1 Tax=Paenibacillus sp. sgz302251 TaxID=3414493 RepID=UPI003C7ED04E
MYRLLIVDDEAIITDGMAEILARLDNPELDICKAYSGEEALNWLNSTRIDLVLSDVRMPGIDGLELMEIIRKNWPRCRIIFLTGFNDFDAIYQAIQTWGVRYLLKTEGYDKVIAAVQEAIRELDEGLRTDRLLAQAREQRNTLEALAHGEYFRHLLAGSGTFNEGVRAEDFRKLNIQLDPSELVLPVFASLIRAAEIPSYADRQEAAMAVKLLGDSYLRDMTRCVGIIDRFGDLLWLVQPTAEKHGGPDAEFTGTVRFLEGTLELIQAACSESLAVDISFMIGSVPLYWESLPQAYDRLRQLQHDRVGDGASMVMTVNVGNHESEQPIRERVRTEKIELLSGHLNGGRMDAFMELLREIFEPARSGRMMEAAQLMELYYSVAFVILSYINQRPTDDQLTAASLLRMDPHVSWHEAFEFLTRTAETLFTLRRQRENSRATGAMEGICSYIEEHLAEDLSLVRLAKQSHFNPSYLSRLFKQETGQNLSEYIDQARIKKAKELLIKEESKIHEVGARVGYEAAHSFTRFFKKMTGVTPQEFREAARTAHL